MFALPKSGQTLAGLVASLTQDSFTFPVEDFDGIVNLTVPKFSFTGATFEMSAALKALGMTDAFDSGAANFQGLCPNPPDGNLYVAKVFQRATLAIDEDGLEAAAATAVEVDDDAGTGSSGPTHTVTLDHPFVVAVVDLSGAIMFLGQIDDPTSTGN